MSLFVAWDPVLPPTHGHFRMYGSPAARTNGDTGAPVVSMLFFLLEIAGRKNSPEEACGRAEEAWRR
jgi:hypothetical protein